MLTPIRLEPRSTESILTTQMASTFWDERLVCLKSCMEIISSSLPSRVQYVCWSFDETIAKMLSTVQR